MENREMGREFKVSITLNFVFALNSSSFYLLCNGQIRIFIFKIFLFMANEWISQIFFPNIQLTVSCLFALFPSQMAWFHRDLK